MKWEERLKEKNEFIKKRIQKENEDKEKIKLLFQNNKEYFFKLVDNYRKQREYQRQYRLKKKMELCQ